MKDTKLTRCREEFLQAWATIKPHWQAQVDYDRGAERTPELCAQAKAVNDGIWRMRAVTGALALQASWFACAEAYRMACAGLSPTWGPNELIPVSDGKTKAYYAFQCLAVLLPVLTVGLVWWLLGAWWLLGGVPVALSLRTKCKAKAEALSRKQRQSEWEKTRGLYEWVARIGSSLELDVTDVPPFLLGALTNRFNMEMPKRKAASKARYEAKLYGYYKPGYLPYEDDLKTGWAADDYRYNYYGRPYDPSCFRGQSGGSASYGGSYSSSEDSDDNQYPMGIVNPANGMPMMPNSCSDVTGHVFGTD